MQAAANWARLCALASSPDPRVELEDARGRVSPWRVMVRWVGGEHGGSAHAALVMFEPIAMFQAARTRPAAPNAREARAFARMYGTDTGFERAKRLTARFAGTSLPLMILAETGTGKDRFARAAHEMSERADVRVVAATCRDLPEQVRQGSFRADLFYRPKGARVTIPPLREREDLLELARGLMRDLCAELGDAVVPTLSKEAAQAVRAYAWPGNVRELKNALHVALVLGDGEPELGLDVLPDEVARCVERAGTTRAGKILDRAEEQALREALDAAGGNMSDAARRLGVARSTLYRMLERHGMR